MRTIRTATYRVPQRTTVRVRADTKVQALSKGSDGHKVYILRQNTKMFGITPDLDKRESDNSTGHYVIGFDKVSWARWVQYTVSPTETPYMKRTQTIDVAGILNDGLVHYGVSNEHLLESLTLDIDADLIIPKMQKTSVSAGLTSSVDVTQLHMDTMSRESFLLLPFTHKVGVILPYDVKEDGQTRIVFTSQVIDPSDNPEMFRQYLASSIKK